MAAAYRQNKKAKEQSVAGFKLIDVAPMAKEPESILSPSNKTSEDDLAFEGLPGNDTKNAPDKKGKPSEDFIPQNDKKSEGSSIPEGLSGNNKQSVSDNNSIISNNIIPSGMKEKQDEEEDENEIGVSKSVLKQKVMDYISAASNQENDDKNSNLSDENDPNRIVHQKGLVTEDLVESFRPAKPAIGKVKEKNNFLGLANNIDLATTNDLNLMFSITDPTHLKNSFAAQQISPKLSGVVGATTALAGLAGTVTGAHDTWRNFKNVDAGGSRFDYINSGIDTLGSAGNMVKGSLNFAKNMATMTGNGVMNTVGSVGGADLIPGLSIATGGANFITGAIEGIRGQRSINKIDQQIKKLDDIKGTKPTEDQKNLMKIFKQGRRISELHRTGGAIKSIGGLASAASGALMLTGVALLTGPFAPFTAAVLGLGAAALGITNFIYGRVKKKNLRKDITADELGFDNWENEAKRVRAQFPGEKLSDHEVKEIILKGNGVDSKKRTPFFKQINLKRAQMLLEIAEKESPLAELAEKVIEALGVHRKKGRYANGAAKLIAEKLGG